MSLDLAVRAASALATAYLRGRDRVGVVGFGGVLRWVLPSTGPGADLPRARLADRHRGGDELRVARRRRDPRRGRCRPARSSLALTPLADDRALAALAALRARGFDLAVVDVSATGRTPAGPRRGRRPGPPPVGAPARGAAGALPAGWACRSCSGTGSSRSRARWPSFGRRGDTPEPCAADRARRQRWRRRPRSPFAPHCWQAPSRRPSRRPARRGAPSSSWAASPAGRPGRRGASRRSRRPTAERSPRARPALDGWAPAGRGRDRGRR